MSYILNVYANILKIDQYVNNSLKVTFWPSLYICQLHWSH